MAAFLSSAGEAVGAQLRVGSAGYSLLFGAVWGAGFSGLVFGGRTVYVTMFDHDYYKNQSRQRYLDKQQIFFKQQQEENEAHRIAALAQEYDPAATRKPFGALEDKYRL